MYTSDLQDESENALSVAMPPFVGGKLSNTIKIHAFVLFYRFLVAAILGNPLWNVNEPKRE